MTAAVLKEFSVWTRKLFAESAILNFIKKPDFFTRAWEESAIFGVFNWLLNFPGRLCRNVYLRLEGIFLCSLAFRLLKAALSRIGALMGLSLALMLIIPDSRWHNIYSTVLIVALAFAFFLKTIICESESFNLKALDFAMIVFAVSSLLAAVTSIFPVASFDYFVLYTACFLLVLLIVSSLKTGGELETFVELLLAGVFLTALYGIWQWKVVGVPVDPSLTDVRINKGMSGRITSTMGNPNVYGELLVLTMPFFWTAIINSRTLLKKALFAVLFVPVMVSLLLTGSRSAWISFAVSVLVFVFFKNKKLIPVMIILGILSIPLLPQPIYDRLMTLSNPNDSSASYRKAILETAMPMLRDYWVTGVGLGTDAFIAIYKRYMSFKLKTVAHTHNLYLQVWLEAGIVALISLIWFVLRLFKKCALSIFNRTDKYINNILIAGLASLAGILVMGLADHVWFYNRIMLIFWADVGVILAGLSIIASKRSSLPQNME